MSKKNIKDYINKKYAVLCTTKEEWDEILKLTNSNKNNYFHVCPSGLFDLSTDSIGNYWSSGSKESIAREYKLEILEAKDFLEEQSTNSLRVDDLVKGQWYKFYWAFLSGYSNCLIKYSHLENDDIYYLKYYITAENNYIGNNKCSKLSSKSEFKNIQKATKEEVLNYFPNEKFEEEALKSLEVKEQQFIVGKWYKVDTSKLNYKKFLRLEGNRFYWLEKLYQYTYGTKHTIQEDWIDMNFFNFTLLTDLSEIQQYLPKDHPDLLKPEAKIEVMEEKFKDGDYLVIISHGSGTHPNDIGKLVKYVSEKPNGEIANNYNEYNVYFEFLPDIEYSTSRLCEEKYGRCKSSMVRKALQHEIPTSNELNSLFENFRMVKPTMSIIKPSENLEFQEPVIIKNNKNKKNKLVTIN